MGIVDNKIERSLELFNQGYTVVPTKDGIERSLIQVIFEWLGLREASKNLEQLTIKLLDLRDKANCQLVKKIDQTLKNKKLLTYSINQVAQQPDNFKYKELFYEFSIEQQKISLDAPQADTLKIAGRLLSMQTEVRASGQFKAIEIKINHLLNDQRVSQNVATLLNNQRTPQFFDYLLEKDTLARLKAVMKNEADLIYLFNKTILISKKELIPGFITDNPQIIWDQYIDSSSPQELILHVYSKLSLSKRGEVAGKLISSLNEDQLIKIAEEEQDQNLRKKFAIKLEEIKVNRMAAELVGKPLEFRKMLLDLKRRFQFETADALITRIGAGFDQTWMDRQKALLHFYRADEKSCDPAVFKRASDYLDEYDLNYMENKPSFDCVRAYLLHRERWVVAGINGAVKHSLSNVARTISWVYKESVTHWIPNLSQLGLGYMLLFKDDHSILSPVKQLIAAYSATIIAKIGLTISFYNYEIIKLATLNLNNWNIDTMFLVEHCSKFGHESSTICTYAPGNEEAVTNTIQWIAEWERIFILASAGSTIAYALIQQHLSKPLDQRRYIREVKQRINVIYR